MLGQGWLTLAGPDGPRGQPPTAQFLTPPGCRRAARRGRGWDLCDFTHIHRPFTGWSLVGQGVCTAPCLWALAAGASFAAEVT